MIIIWQLILLFHQMTPSEALPASFNTVETLEGMMYRSR